MRHVVVVCALAAVSVIGGLSALAARSQAARFTLIAEGVHEVVPVSDAFPFGIRHTGTFTASAPFCARGTFVDRTFDALDGAEDTRVYTCADDSGALIVAAEAYYEHNYPNTDTWRVLDGTGRYVGLRGKGTFHGELLTGDVEDPHSTTFRSTLTGYADYDGSAPTIALTGLTATKLRRPAGTYSLRFTLLTRDNGNTVSYMVAVEPAGGGPYLAQKQGSTASGRVTMSLRVRPARGTRSVVLQLWAADPIGNARWSTRRMTLPR